MRKHTELNSNPTFNFFAPPPLMSIEEFLGGFRVLQPSYENLRDPPLDVFDTFPYEMCHTFWDMEIGSLCSHNNLDIMIRN